MKIAVIADIHHDASAGSESCVLATVREFAQRAALENADVLLDLGDRIVDRSKEWDRKSLSEVASALAIYEGPRIHLLGNHDVINLDWGDNAELLRYPVGNRVQDFDQCRLISWQPDPWFEPGVGFGPAGPSLPWLIETLLSDPRPTIIATHAPFSGQSQVGNFHFEKNPEWASHPDHASVRQAVEATGRAVIWLAGHVHWNSFHVIRGLRHVTLQSVSETFTTHPARALSYAMIDIGDEIVIEVFGNDPLKVVYPGLASPVSGHHGTISVDNCPIN
ncbi:metallophosphoesterase family protein [Rhizobium etli]|uniref:metallophosphoesterase family protein n=1 Tax=Rhizobium etli TaxID=29449 RepID=UPI000383991E|nr:metallophosphoesterase [Rhizobium etli]AGS24540.1 calcineurin-like phosphoesterase domain-containing protein [Rhizobium etli bv. mimosae str. Mim1]